MHPRTRRGAGGSRSKHVLEHGVLDHEDASGNCRKPAEISSTSSHRRGGRRRGGFDWVPRRGGAAATAKNSAPIQSRVRLTNNSRESAQGNCEAITVGNSIESEDRKFSSERIFDPVSGNSEMDELITVHDDAKFPQLVLSSSMEPSLSRDQLDTNSQLLEDEIFALEAIFGDNILILENVGELRSMQINVQVKPSDEFLVTATLGSSSKLKNDGGFSYSFRAKYLPPMEITCLFPKSYPSHHPPLFTIYVQWLSSSKISSLCSKLDSIWRDQPGQEIVFQWIDWLQNSSLSFVGFLERIELGPYGDEYYGDPRARSGSVSPDVDIPILQKYNEGQNHAIFLNTIEECCICYNQYLGSEFMKLPCHHFFCWKCMKTFSDIHVKEGTVNKLLCPNAKCGGAIPPPLLKKLLGNEGYERWESFMLQKTLDSMADIAYCPRCETPTIEDEDHHAICSKCFYSFCNLCRERRHVGTECMTPETKLEILKQRQNSASLGELQKQKERDLINNIMSLKEALRDAKHCPSCRMLISKTEGCNKMECTNCGQYFCYRCCQAIAGYDHFREGTCDLFPTEEIARWEEQLNHRQALGQINAQLFADNLHTCPNCRQFNAKVGNNNHIFCWACQMHYCYLCRNLVRRRSKHFGPHGCKQHTLG